MSCRCWLFYIAHLSNLVPTLIYAWSSLVTYYLLSCNPLLGPNFISCLLAAIWWVYVMLLWNHVQEFLVLSRGDAIRLLVQYEGSVENVFAHYLWWFIETAKEPVQVLFKLSGALYYDFVQYPSQLHVRIARYGWIPIWVVGALICMTFRRFGCCSRVVVLRVFGHFNCWWHSSLLKIFTRHSLILSWKFWMHMCELIWCWVLMEVTAKQ